MSLTGTYGSFCELVAATQLYPIYTEVCYNGEFYVQHGNNDNPVKRLKSPCESQMVSRIRRAILSGNIRKKQLNDSIA
ncbi:hypothetical protein FF38_05541 [Lucilia cuprina]|uniref:Uncharacterized protein n=1 Tax=Lucilia cuprina TaxID=7375 RepID=A0A0L0CAG4_LUCCU|nr:hypothetical protein FF38_05541 [Lucilia cuprina]